LTAEYRISEICTASQIWDVHSLLFCSLENYKIYGKIRCVLPLYVKLLLETFFTPTNAQ
jgi:hypothetical protein